MTDHHSATFLEKALDKEATHNPSVALGAPVLSELHKQMQLACSCACTRRCHFHG